MVITTDTSKVYQSVFNLFIIKIRNKAHHLQNYSALSQRHQSVQLEERERAIQGHKFQKKIQSKNSAGQHGVKLKSSIQQPSNIQGIIGRVYNDRENSTYNNNKEEKIMRNKLKKKYAKMHEENFRVLLKDIKVNLSE